MNPETNAARMPIRKIPFEFIDTIDPIWNAAKPEWSHMVNGTSLAMPYLEPFLIKNVREALAQIDEPSLAEDVRAFVGQEAQHYTNHRRYNEVLKRNGYPELEAVEAEMAQTYKRLETKSLKWRLAYTAGFETMTIGLTEWLIRERSDLFTHANPVVASLVLWHMVEETEHKTVAFDVYQHLYGHYFMRVYGLFYAALHVMFSARRTYKLMLQRDGTWRQWSSRVRLWRMVGQFYRNVTPALFRSLAPGHHPDHVADPDWIAQWATAYAELPAQVVPLLDTDDPAIPARFVS
ncbi:MAG: metal-dependent hydrolase [Gammaproteobacteria bacterium]|nr:MAG: metal-dependent hydrolase [Gammaproteobacteria bacterium]